MGLKGWPIKPNALLIPALRYIMTSNIGITPKVIIRI